jgi:hypothetical protein
MVYRPFHHCLSISTMHFITVSWISGLSLEAGYEPALATSLCSTHLVQHLFGFLPPVISIFVTFSHNNSIFSVQLFTLKVELI